MEIHKLSAILIYGPQFKIYFFGLYLMPLKFCFCCLKLLLVVELSSFNGSAILPVVKC